MPVISPGSSSGIYQLLCRQSHSALVSSTRVPPARRSAVVQQFGPRPSGIWSPTPYYSPAPYQPAPYQQLGSVRRSVSCTR
jgi:hypothetical protein